MDGGAAERQGCVAGTELGPPAVNTSAVGTMHTARMALYSRVRVGLGGTGLNTD
jgi:hypothetical protein